MQSTGGAFDTICEKDSTLLYSLCDFKLRTDKYCLFYIDYNWHEILLCEKYSSNFYVDIFIKYHYYIVQTRYT